MTEVCDAIERYGLEHVGVVEVTTFLVRVISGGDRRASTNVLYEKAVDTYDRRQSPEIRAERRTYIDAIAVVTGMGHAGIQRRVEQLAALRERGR